MANSDGREAFSRRLRDALQKGGVGADSPTQLARDFNTLLISGVPRFDDSNRLEDAALRFIHLVDTCYDHRVNLIISADAKPNELYGGRRHRAEFARTESRLIEMQSADYQGQAHLG